MMPLASRVQLIPPAAWDEAALLAMARALEPPMARPVRPGDAIGELVVARVEPEPGAAVGAATEFEILPTPRPADAASVDLAIMLDVSASMETPWDARHTRLDAARTAVAAFLAAPSPAAASVSLHEYAKECARVAGPAPPSALALAPSPKPKGASRTGGALDTVLAELLERATADRAQAILLLTDGVGEVDDLLAAAARAGRLRIPIHALVFAPELDDAFDALATASRGSAQKAAYPLTIEFVHEPGARP